MPVPSEETLTEFGVSGHVETLAESEETSVVVDLVDADGNPVVLYWL